MKKDRVDEMKLKTQLKVCWYDFDVESIKILTLLQNQIFDIDSMSSQLYISHWVSHEDSEDVGNVIGRKTTS